MGSYREGTMTISPKLPQVITEPEPFRITLWRWAWRWGIRLYIASLVLPIVWEILGKGGPDANGSNFAALGLPDWVGMAVIGLGVFGMVAFVAIGLPPARPGGEKKPPR